MGKSAARNSNMIITPEQDEELRSYFRERYELLGRRPFSAKHPVWLRDHEDEACRRCRFCLRGRPDVTFQSVAHAVPEFLGNKAILSMNECDECNKFLATNYEDHLSKWSLLGRTISQVRGKRGRPAFKTKTLRIDPGEKGLDIKLKDPAITNDEMRDGGPFEFTLPGDTTSQPHIPVRAAMALIKVACSICPAEELPQCRGAIDWLMQRKEAAFHELPVLYASTPGPISQLCGEVILLRRKNKSREPYLWCLVQFGNVRLQAFVPFCPADWPNESHSISHLPSRFGPNWKYGPTEYGDLDWSDTELVQTDMKVRFHVNHASRSEAAERAQDD